MSGVHDRGVTACAAGTGDGFPTVEPALPVATILARMRRVEGWFAEDEAVLLMAATARALVGVGGRPCVVEIGSYCGRSTVVLGSVAREVRPDARVFAVDPHEGELGTAQGGRLTLAPTLAKFTRAITAAGLGGVVVPVVKRSHEVAWDGPIRLLLIDGLHDAASVALDFGHFERWVEPGGFVAFHDYSAGFPGVVAFVDGLVARGGYQPVARARGLVVLVKPVALRPGPGAVLHSTNESERCRPEPYREEASACWT